jgi:hypothetical protein
LFVSVMPECKKRAECISVYKNLFLDITVNER